MSTPPSPSTVKSVLAKWLGPRLKLYPGWETRTRPGGVNVNGFINHHTGGPFTHSASYLQFLFETGRPAEGIPGPLCNMAIDDLGYCHLGSIRRTNNAGPGKRNTLNHVIAEDYPGYSKELDPSFPDDLSDGNHHYWGVEVMYPGTVPMKQAQHETLIDLNAAVMDLFGWTALSVIAHREHTYRKSDPYGVKLYDVRKQTKARLEGGPVSAGGPEHWDSKDWNAIEKKLITRVFEVVWKRDGAIRNQSIADTTDPAAYGPANWFLSDIENTQDTDHKLIGQTAKDVKAVLDALASTPPGSTIVSSFTDDALAELAAAANNELDRRAQARYGTTP